MCSDNNRLYTILLMHNKGYAYVARDAARVRSIDTNLEMVIDRNESRGGTTHLPDARVLAV